MGVRMQEIFPEQWHEEPSTNLSRKWNNHNWWKLKTKQKILKWVETILKGKAEMKTHLPKKSLISVRGGESVALSLDLLSPPFSTQPSETSSTLTMYKKIGAACYCSQTRVVAYPWGAITISHLIWLYVAKGLLQASWQKVPWSSFLPLNLYS